MNTGVSLVRATSRLRRRVLGAGSGELARRIWLIPVCVLICSGCAATSSQGDAYPRYATDYETLKERLEVRRDSTHTASYRVRWRARGIEPHAEMILHIDYRAPDQFHIVGRGPLDMLVFTAWVVDSQFVLVDHQSGRTQSGGIGELWADELPPEAPSLGELLGLFRGSCGVDISAWIERRPGQARGRWLTILGSHVAFHFDLQKQRLTRVVWSAMPEFGGTQDVAGEARFGSFSEHYPFWRLRSGYWKDPESRGEHRWEVLAQKFNHDLPERLFVPPARP